MPDDLGSDVNVSANVTSEVASAHQHLQNQCEKFEAFIDKLCASSLESLRPYKFYECVLAAADCADALTQFQAASPCEDKAYEAEVAKADEILDQQKSSSKNNAAKKIAEIQEEVLSYESDGKKVGVRLGVMNINAEKFL
ncbi:MAG: hypothetical protein J4F29_19010 [Candidatus Latescibacteria bacterium]|nr:hypothetical protein [Candidatus Latescibacterota bacterium]